MNPIPKCFQKISPGKHFRTYGTYIRMYVRTDKGDAICSPHYKWRGHKNGSFMKVESIAECFFGAFCNTFDLH